MQDYYFTPGERQIPSDTVSVNQIIEVLRRHKKLVASIAAATLAIAVLLAVTERDVYRAVAVVRITSTRSVFTGQRDRVDPLSRATDPLLSRIEVLRSRTLIGTVVDSLGLRLRSESPDFKLGTLTSYQVDPEALPDTVKLTFSETGVSAEVAGQVAEAPYGEELDLGIVRLSLAERPEAGSAKLYLLPREKAIDRTLASLSVRQREGTDIVDLAFTSPNPNTAQRVANAIALTFQQNNLAAAREQSRRHRLFVAEQLSQTDSMLAEAQGALSAFRSRQSVSRSAERLSAEQTALVSLDARVEEMAAERQIVQSLADRLRSPDEADRTEAVRAVASLPEWASHPVIRARYEQLIRHQSRLDSLTTGPWRSAPTNPDVVQARGLVRAAEDQIADALESYLISLDARIAGLEELRDRTASNMRTLPAKEAEESRLARRVEVMTSMADRLREEYQQAQIAENVQVGDVEVVDLAALPYRPEQALRMVKVAVGLLFGLALGGGAAFLREHQDTSIRRPEDLEAELHLPGLAVIPPTEFRVGPSRRFAGLLPGRVIEANGSEAYDELVTLQDVPSLGKEAYRMLRTSVLGSVKGKALRTIVVTSAAAGEGKTSTAANMAITFAQKGMRVLIVDCDARRPRLHRLFAVEKEPGLADLLDPDWSPRLKLTWVVKETVVDGLFVLPCGSLPANPSHLFEGPRIRALVEEVAREYDLVVLDTAPVLSVADSTILGALVDGVLLVVRAGHTNREGARRAYVQLAQAGVRVLGAVLNDAEGELDRYGYTYYSHYAGPAWDG